MFYGAELPATAITEKAFYRLLFFTESPKTPWPSDAGEFTVFAVEYATERAIDCRADLLRADGLIWTHPTDYDGCHRLADACRTANIDLIQYQSIRSRTAALNLAILKCRTFSRSEPVETQSWRIHLSASGVRALCDFPRSTVAFDREFFAGDPRIAGMSWER